jgi:hypothetical protein
MSSHNTTSTRHRLLAMKEISALGPQPLVWRVRLVIREQWGNSHSESTRRYVRTYKYNLYSREPFHVSGLISRASGLLTQL